MGYGPALKPPLCSGFLRRIFCPWAVYDHRRSRALFVCSFSSVPDLFNFTMTSPQVPTPAHIQADSMLARRFGKETVNYFSSKDP